MAFIAASGHEFEIIKYLEDVPTFIGLKSIIYKLNIKPIELVRKNEKIWIENFTNPNISDDEVIKAMILYPILIERPIVIYGDKAVIARPVEKISVLQL